MMGVKQQDLSSLDNKLKIFPKNLKIIKILHLNSKG